MPTNHIIAGGRKIPCAVPVRLWPEHGLTFAGLKPRASTRAVVCHWTGAENPPERVHRTLIARGLSVHFCIGTAGEVFQYCDADMRCSHAGLANAWSVGIEIVNAAGTKPVPDKTARALLRETIHGREFTYTAFTPAQVRSALALVAALCEAYALPMQVPLENITRSFKRGEAALDHEPVKRVIPRLLRPEELAEFKGVIGHFHVSAQKRDAGIALLQAIGATDQRHEQGIGGPAE